MPELPDLLHVLAVLRREVLSREVTAARVRNPVVLRSVVRANLSDLVGRTVDDVLRRAHFLVFRLGDLDLAVNPMLAGRFRLAAADAKDEGTLAFALGFAGRELRYLDEKSMGKAYLLAKGEWRGVPGLEKVGVDVLSPEFTRERLAALLAGRREQVRAFLMDKTALDSMGNAYADEVLFEAGLHPKTWARSLTADDVTRLFAAIVSVLGAARDEVARRDPPIDTRLRDFLKVRLKDRCPRCGAKIRRAVVRSMDASFCPRCQPERRPGFIDWKKTLS